MTDVQPRFKQDPAPERDTSDLAHLRPQTRANASGWCQATGLHMPSRIGNDGTLIQGCPTWDGPDEDLADQFVAHHIQPTSMGGLDEPGNLIWLWNGSGRFGAGGCHGRVHGFPLVSRPLGLLRLREDDPLFGIGLEAALADGWLRVGHIRSAGIEWP